MRQTLHFRIETGEKFLIASCAEISEAIGQGLSVADCLRDLADSVESVFDYRDAESNKSK